MHSWFSNSERRENCKLLGCLLFNADRFVIEAPIRDEMTIYRARKSWKKALKEGLMLDDNRDFKITTLRMPEVVSRPTENALPGGDDSENCGIAIQCYFLTSFGRYAFWRIASLQAPEILDELLASFEKIKTPLPSDPPQGKRTPISQPTIVKSAMLSIDHAFPHSEISVAAKTVQIISLLVKKIRGPST